MDVTAAEKAVLEVLWDLTTATRRELVGRLYPDARESDRATVQKLLERLEKKGLVQRDARQRVHKFRALINREEYVGKRLESLADSLCGGSFEPLISHLVRADKLSGQDLIELRALIDASDALPQRSGRKVGRRKK